ncbi:Sec-independent protein translocase protein TatB [Moritella sp. F3]|uniref:Sec-independent protein translocase protein TatB n=1 Tax=Moritella sp. F3 TaxID=2718882 RepID=UPI0018E0DD85|nr:Sec-independent protein translocase protein TatB [Moritella sp. F3]GIC79452.1 sec-independent protein translocase protein TatB [Moritella sp. F1]GIC84123.1 sec-independent protein translocase protein TatB [Moritella sp. F3]
MFDIGFWEIVVISVLGLLVLGPERLPVAIKTVSTWVKTIKGAANSVKDELSHELKIQEMHDNLKKAEQQGMNNISPELQDSIDSLRDAAASVTRPYADAESSTAASTSTVEQAPKIAEQAIEQDKK